MTDESRNLLGQGRVTRRILLKAGAAAGAGLAALGSPVLSEALSRGPAEAASLSGTLTWGTWFDFSNPTTVKSSLQTQTLLHFIDEYKKVQPGVAIKPVYQSADQRSWLQTQIIAGSAPDVCWDWTQPNTLYATVKNIVDLAPLLQQKNPYSPNKHWQDDFLDGSLQYDEDTAGHIWAVNDGLWGASGVTAFAYNQTILDKLRLGSPPNWTWDEFLAKLAVIKTKSNYIPFLMSAAGQADYPLGWTFNLLLLELWEPGLTKRLMSIKVSPKDLVIGYMPTQKQLCYALKKGIFSFDDPHVLEVLRLMKEWSAYWQPGFLSPVVGDPFAQGKAAFTWMYNGGQWDTITAFSWGSMTPPPITKVSSPLGTGAIWRTLGASGSPVRVDTPYFIPQSTVKKGRLPLALDFVQFMTAPAQQAYYNLPGKNAIPSIKPGIPLDKIFTNPKTLMRQRAFFSNVVGRPGWQAVDSLDNAASIGVLQQLQVFLGGGESAQQCAKQIQSVALRETQKIIAQNPGWNAASW